MRVGAFCMGYGGLEMALSSLTATDLRWYCEIDPHACKVLEARFPGVPNLGDLTAVDWSSVEPVDSVTAGYPCQPFSHAGARKGTDDARHLWPFIADALRVLRPRYGLFENVRGHVSLGFDVVLGDLARLGFDAEWTLLRAADVGAPHGRARLFILAADASVGGPPGGADLRTGEPDARRSDRVTATDPSGERHGGGQDGRGVGRVDGEDAVPPRQRQRTRQVAVDRSAAAAADTEGERRAEGRAQSDGGRSATGSAGTPGDPLRSGRDGRTPDQGRGPLGRTAAAGGGEVDWGSATAADADPICDECGCPEDYHQANGFCAGPCGGECTDGGRRLPNSAYATVPANLGGLNGNTPEAGPGQDLRGVRTGVHTATVRQETGRSNPIPVAPALQPKLRQHEGPGREGHPALASAPAPEGALRDMQEHGGPARSPHGSEPVEQRPLEPGDPVRGVPSEAALVGGLAAPTQWGQYEAAIRRWEPILGREAPPPTDERGRLSPRFVEFLMGLPDGWVTDLLPRSPALKCLGNGVVPRQATAAFSALFERLDAREMAA